MVECSVFQQNIYNDNESQYLKTKSSFQDLSVAVCKNTILSFSAAQPDTDISGSGVSANKSSKSQK